MITIVNAVPVLLTYAIKKNIHGKIQVCFKGPTIFWCARRDRAGKHLGTIRRAICKSLRNNNQLGYHNRISLFYKLRLSIAVANTTLSIDKSL